MTLLIIAIFAIIELTLFLTFKNNFYHVTPSLVLSKLYSNSLLVLLNNRSALRSGKQSIHLEGLDVTSRDHSSVTRSGIQVNINNETFTDNVAMVSLSKVCMDVFDSTVTIRTQSLCRRRRNVVQESEKKTPTSLLQKLYDQPI